MWITHRCLYRGSCPVQSSNQKKPRRIMDGTPYIFPTNPSQKRSSEMKRAQYDDCKQSALSEQNPDKRPTFLLIWTAMSQLHTAEKSSQHLMILRNPWAGFVRIIYREECLTEFCEFYRWLRFYTWCIYNEWCRWKLFLIMVKYNTWGGYDILNGEP